MDRIAFIRSRNANRRELHRSQGELDFLLEVFGDQLAEEKGYKDLDGIEALRYYLMQKHHWLPRDVRSLSYEDIRFALHSELQGWTAPAGVVP